MHRGWVVADRRFPRKKEAVACGPREGSDAESVCVQCSRRREPRHPRADDDNRSRRPHGAYLTLQEHDNGCGKAPLHEAVPTETSLTCALNRRTDHAAPLRREKHPQDVRTGASLA